MCKKCKSQKSNSCIFCGKRLLKQELIWIPIGKPYDDNDTEKVKIAPILYNGEKPKYLWTLINEVYSNKKPQLPIKPIHFENAFLESYIHDWDIVENYIHYNSSASYGGNWILLEFEK
jgi:hypothetical protein